jgi:hypothetical protein
VTRLSINQLLERRVTSLHESAHAVVARALGQRVVRLELFLHDDQAQARGRCTYERSELEDQQFVEAVIGVAGGLATEAVWPDERRISETDIEDWKQLPPDRQEAALALATKLLVKRWGRVEELAEHLQARDCITEEDPLLITLLEHN